MWLKIGAGYRKISAGGEKLHPDSKSLDLAVGIVPLRLDFQLTSSMTDCTPGPSSGENGGEKLGHGSGGMELLRAA